MSDRDAPVTPGAVLGLLGGGQLGRMFALEAKRMGYRVAVLEPAHDAPCSQVADEVLAAPYTDRAALRRLSEISAVLTYEFENVDADSVEFLESLESPVFPGSRALRITQDRLREKSFAREAGIGVTAFASVAAEEDLQPAAGVVGFPAILKTARGGYDGKGQRRVRDAAELRAARGELPGPLILERVVPFACELSVVACRGRDGSFAAYPPAENLHVRGILDTSLLPARVSADTAAAAQAIARRVGEGLHLVGAYCVELFALEDGGLLLNEIAPRPHNSGHATLDACLCSQFEQQVRAICGLPLGSTTLLRSAALINILGTGQGNQLQGVAELLRNQDTALHLYGKTIAAPGRKMGHITVLGDSPDAAMAQAQSLRHHLNWRS